MFAPCSRICRAQRQRAGVGCALVCAPVCSAARFVGQFGSFQFGNACGRGQLFDELVKVSSPSLHLAPALEKVSVPPYAASTSETVRRVLSRSGGEAVGAMFSKPRFYWCVAKVLIRKGRSMCTRLAACGWREAVFGQV